MFKSEAILGSSKFASRTATLLPRSASAIAKLIDKVLFPVPPLPLAIATTSGGFLSSMMHGPFRIYVVCCVSVLI